MSDGGKGSAPRKQQDHEAYAKNWELIFGKKQKDHPTLGAVDVTVEEKSSGVPSHLELG
jgi:hypothetical protein